MTEPDIFEALRRIGFCDECRLEPLRVTGNNRIFRAEADGRVFLVKKYFQHPDDPRDRFATERAFYTFLWDGGIRRIPQPLAWAPDERLALFEFIPGERPASATHEFVRQALHFFLEINALGSRPGATLLPLASEACFSLSEHLACVEKRVSRLGGIEPASPIDERAAAFVRDKLSPAWDDVREAAMTRSEPALLDRRLDCEDRCISPSDFGFHNAICASDWQLRFLDFEYAGWDDPAKTICDFFCQPAVPAPISCREVFVGEIAKKHGPHLNQRVATLFPVYQVKWCCIMLNDFLPADSRRRAFSNPAEDATARKRRQLEKAERALQRGNS